MFSEEVSAQLKRLQDQELIASHLEALQVLERSALPLMWISGSRFTLYPAPQCSSPLFTVDYLLTLTIRACIPPFFPSKDLVL